MGIPRDQKEPGNGKDSLTETTDHDVEDGTDDEADALSHVGDQQWDDEEHGEPVPLEWLGAHQVDDDGEQHHRNRLGIS